VSEDVTTLNDDGPVQNLDRLAPGAVTISVTVSEVATFHCSPPCSTGAASIVGCCSSVVCWDFSRACSEGLLARLQAMSEIANSIATTRAMILLYEILMIPFLPLLDPPQLYYLVSSPQPS